VPHGIHLHYFSYFHNCPRISACTFFSNIYQSSHSHSDRKKIPPTPTNVQQNNPFYFLIIALNNTHVVIIV
jgi:hypothetical protein